MNAQESAIYEAAKSELDGVYAEVNGIRQEFKDLIAEMAAQLLAERVAS